MILVLLAAAAQAVAQPQSAAPPPSAEHGMPHHAPHRQLFVAPSGEPFRAAPDAPFPVADWFAGANTGHDGKLTEAQFTTDFVRFADTLDLDHDGVIDGAEVQNYETNIVPEVHAPDFRGPGAAGNGEGGWSGHHGGSNWGGGAERPKGLGRFELLPLPEPVTAMDTQSNGRITRQEVLDAAHLRFAQLDTAHRGYLTLGDLPKTWLQTRREMFRHYREHGDRDRSGAMGGGFGGGSGDGTGWSTGGGDQDN